jgi:diguanylate cyclase (GGDEF)-like protein/PAS domain S-box-containing protein
MRRALPLALALLCLSLTALLAWQEDREERRALQRSFDTELRDTAQRISQRMAAHEQLLQGAQALMTSQPGLDEALLRRYLLALPLGADHAGLQGLGLVRFQQGEALLRLLEPSLAHNQPALGRDWWACAPCRAALEAARDSGHAVLSAPLELRPLGLRAGRGVVMALALYQGEPPQGAAQRRERLMGWLVAPLQLAEMMGALYGEQAAGLNLEIYAGQRLEPAQRLYRHPGWRAQPPLAKAEEYLVVGGQTWTIHLQADAGFAPAQGLGNARVILFCGAAVSLLVGLLAWALMGSRLRAQGLAERMTAALRESEQRWAYALEGAGDGVWDWDMVAGQIRCSTRAQLLLGWPDAQLPAAQLLPLLHPEDVEMLRHDLQRCLQGRAQALACEFRVRHAALGWAWVLARGTVVERGADQRPHRLTGTLSDIHARRQSEDRVRHMAQHDPLTELANRAYFSQRVQQALANARRYKESVGLILIDLDRFKPVNDQYGHAVGDELLVTIARRLKNSVRETDTVGRIGGDEFVVLLTGPVTRDSAQVVIDKIFNQIALPIEIQGLRLEITCSLGLALYPQDGGDEMSLTKAADAAMYRNKRAGRRLARDAGRDSGESDTDFSGFTEL